MSASKPPSTTVSLTSSIVAEARGALLARKASLTTGADGKATDAATAELRELDAALKRIEDGTWGRCVTCGGAIGRTRLRSLPEARQCLPCARAQP
jgi:RNA polymerase-binding transcription factor DksA